jgi:hypothetical protein
MISTVQIEALVSAGAAEVDSIVGAEEVVCRQSPAVPWRSVVQRAYFDGLRAR